MKLQIKNNPYLVRSVLVGLVLVGFSRFMLGWFGAFVINFFGRAIVIDSIVPAVVIGVLLLVATILKPALVWSTRSLLIVVLLICTMFIYGETSLQNYGPLKNKICSAPPAMEKYEDFNLVLISLDTLRADRVHSYGYDRETSPSMDRLADQGILFENNYSQAPATLISHSSMVTGLYPGTHGGQCMDYTPLPKSARTLAEIMQTSGYKTAGFTGGAQLSIFFGFSQGFDAYDQEGGGMANIWPRAKNWLDNQVDPNEKFFLMLHSYDIHHPYDPPAPFNKMFFPDYDGPLGDSISLELLQDINMKRTQITRTDARYISAVYDGGITYTDQYVGMVMDYLAEKELLDKTIIVLTSDHGEEFDEHGEIGNHSHTVYNELLHVPLIIRVPGLEPARIADRVELVDLVPSLLDLLDIAYPPEAFQGASFSGLIAETQQPADVCESDTRLLFAEKEHLSMEEVGRLKTVTVDNWKFIGKTEPASRRAAWRILGSIIYPYKGRELYNLNDDPTEQHNLAFKHLQRTRSMENLFYRMIAWNEKESIDPDGETLQIDKEEIQRLKDLGYVH